MDNSLNLKPGHSYTVVKSFTDYDRLIHQPGETWIYQGTNFLPYEDGLTLHVSLEGRPIVYRLQWREEEQAAIIEHFSDYVKLT